MENIADLMHGFQVALTGYHLALMVAGVLLGILVGVLPGLGAPNGVTLLIPLTFSMDPVSAIILLASMYWGALFGGSTTSILFNIPGEPSSVATTFDGHPMAKQGRATEALSYAFLSAAFGALFGVVLITLLAVSAAKFAHKFSSPEYFAVYFLAFACFVGLGGASPFKTLVSMPAWASPSPPSAWIRSPGSLRLTFGLHRSGQGRQLPGRGDRPVRHRRADRSPWRSGSSFDGVQARVSPRDVLKTIAALPRYWVALLRSSLVGCWMGITPGGPTAASFMSYGLASASRRARQSFGKGEPEGIIAPEAADHAAGTSAMLPMLALGIPGSATAAVMMGGLMIWGLQSRPDAVHRAEEFRVGPDRLDVSRQRGGAWCWCCSPFRCSPPSCAFPSPSSGR